MKKIAALSGLLIWLAACSSDLPPPAAMTNILQPKISLDVQVIDLADRSAIQPASSPYNDNHFSPTINDAIHQWASDHLQAIGQNGQAIVLIKDASLKAQTLPKKDGIDTWFTRQQTLQYSGHAEVSVEANGRAGFATANAVATRSVTLPENPTGMEKQDAYQNLLNGLMKDLSANLEAAIRTHMGAFVTAAAVIGASANAQTAETPPPPTVPPMTAPEPMPQPALTTPALPPAPPTPSPVAPAVIPLSGGK